MQVSICVRNQAIRDVVVAVAPDGTPIKGARIAQATLRQLSDNTSTPIVQTQERSEQPGVFDVTSAAIRSAPGDVLQLLINFGYQGQTTQVERRYTVVRSRKTAADNAYRALSIALSTRIISQTCDGLVETRLQPCTGGVGVAEPLLTRRLLDVKGQPVLDMLSDVYRQVSV